MGSYGESWETEIYAGYYNVKSLTVVRHAKAGWGKQTQNDFQRPLNERGLHDSAEMAQRLFAQGLVPQQIVASPALRAITTARRFADTFGLEPTLLTTDHSIYEASSDNLHDVVWGLSDDYNDIMLVGHNPGLSDLVRSLASQMIDELATCEVVILQFDCEVWHTIDLHSGRLSFNDAPRKHNNTG